MSQSESSSSPEPTTQENREPKFLIESLEESNSEQGKFTIVSIKNDPNQQHQQQQQSIQQPLQQQEPESEDQSQIQPPSSVQPPPQQQQPQIQVQKYRVTRTFHDFQFLEQQLFHSGQCLYGYILPPFPQSLNSSKELSTLPETKGGRPLPGYGRFVSDEHQLLLWLNLVLEHPVFGHSGLIEPFLTEKTIPPPGKIVKPLGIIKSIQDTFDSRKYAHKDCDIFFQNERDNSIKLFDFMQSATEAFNSTINAKHSLSQVLAHLSAALSVPIGDNTGIDKVAMQTNLAFTRGLDCYREFVEAETINSSATLGATLLLWTRFVENEKEMLKQRTCLLVDYEAANRNYDRARGQRRPEIEEAKTIAERNFERCSDIARVEVKRFQARRMKDLASSLMKYRNSELAIAKEYYQKLAGLCEQINNELSIVN